MITVRKEKADIVGQCNACDYPYATDIVYEIHMNYMTIRLCQEHFTEMLYSYEDTK